MAKHPEPQSSFIGDWRPADMTYARALLRRGLLGEHRISWRDPTCLECGHRAWDHGLENLPIHEQVRWFREEPTACKWKGCGCGTWRPNMHAKTMIEHVGQVRVTDAWVEVPMGRWVVAYRIVNDRGTPVVGELRIFPNEEGRPALGQWSGELLGANAKVPRGGITTRQLRGVRVLAYLRHMVDQVARLRAKAPDLAKHWGWGEDVVASDVRRAAPRRGAQRGRKGRPDAFYAGIAAEYVLALESGSKRPIADIAKHHHDIDHGQARDIIREARKRGLLTTLKSNARGGVLTLKGLSLLTPPLKRAIDAIPRKAAAQTVPVVLGPGADRV